MSPLQTNEDPRVELSGHMQCLDCSGTPSTNKGSEPRCDFSVQDESYGGTNEEISVFYWLY